MAGPLKAEGDGGTVDGDEFGVAAMGAEHGADFFKGGFDFLFHGVAFRERGKRKPSAEDGRRRGAGNYFLRNAASLRGWPSKSRILSWGIWTTASSETPSATRRRRCSRRRRALAAPDLRGRVVSLLRLLRDMVYSCLIRGAERKMATPTGIEPVLPG